MGIAGRAVVVRAGREALAGVAHPGPHQLYRWPRLTVEPRPLGGLAPASLRVQMVLAGICGTDLRVVRGDPATGYVLGSAPLDLGPDGRVLGHEGVGRVIEVGAATHGFRPGDFVSFESLLTCQTCVACRRGQFNHCRAVKLVGGEVDGLFRNVVDLPARLAHDVSDLARTGDGLRAAACIEPAACAHVAVERAGVRAGECVVVFGGGPIGLFAAMLCRDVFAARVELVEPLAGRRALAAAWCDRAWEVEEFFATDDAEPIDVVLEAAGELDNVARLFGRLGPCARVALLARSGAPLHLAAIDRLISNGVTIFGSRGHLGGSFDDVIRLVRMGRLPLHRVVTGEVDGLGAIQRELQAEQPLEERHAKLLARLGSPNE